MPQQFFRVLCTKHQPHTAAAAAATIVFDFLSRNSDNITGILISFIKNCPTKQPNSFCIIANEKWFPSFE